MTFKRIFKNTCGRIYSNEKTKFLVIVCNYDKSESFDELTDEARKSLHYRKSLYVVSDEQYDKFKNELRVGTLIKRSQLHYYIHLLTNYKDIERNFHFNIMKNQNDKAMSFVIDPYISLADNLRNFYFYLSECLKNEFTNFYIKYPICMDTDVRFFMYIAGHVGTIKNDIELKLVKK